MLLSRIGRSTSLCGKREIDLCFPSRAVAFKLLLAWTSYTPGRGPAAHPNEVLISRPAKGRGRGRSSSVATANTQDGREIDQSQAIAKDTLGSPLHQHHVAGIIRNAADKAKSIRRSQATKLAKRREAEERRIKLRDPTAEWHPYPAIPELSKAPREVLPSDFKGLPFRSTNDASDFIEGVRRAAQVELGILKSPQRPSKPFIVVAHLSGLSPHLLAEPYQHIERVVGMGVQMRSRGAETLAKLDLAERLYRILRTPEEYLPASCRRVLSKDRTRFLTISLSAGLRQRIVQTNRLLNESGIFQTYPHLDDESTALNLKGRQSKPLADPPSRGFTPLPKDIINGLTPPKRESSRLPIHELFHRIVTCIEGNNVTVLSAATGSGKTTQLPQYILDYYLQAREHFDRPPSVLVTQPRRIAAKTVAQRVATERGQMHPSGAQAVGYSVRFESRPPTALQDGSILFCTAGVLLRRLQKEPNLASVTHLILDEVHERDVFTDILLLVTRGILKQRPDLRLILMSATMSADKFVNYFREEGLRVGTVLDVEGTNYPVTDMYLEEMVQKFNIRTDNLSRESQEYLKTELSLVRTCEIQENALIVEEEALKEVPLDLMAELMRNIITQRPPGAILVFLPGWEEITQLHQLLQTRLPPGINGESVEYHLLHSTSPLGAADAAFKRPPPGVRKVILATNLAESSITIPDVVYVIDSGKQKVMHYDQRLRMNILEPCWISKANLRQRLGRAGRCQPGEYYGMISRVRSLRLPEQTLPELLRLSLDEVCLNLKAMGLTGAAGRILGTAMDPPERGAVRAAIERLHQIGAIDGDERLTPLGRLLANLPLHPGKLPCHPLLRRLKLLITNALLCLAPSVAMGRMLITASIFGCISPILSTVGLLGQKLFRPARLAEEKYDLHVFYRRMASDCSSDHLLAHRLFNTWRRNANTGYDGGSSLPSKELLPYEALLSRAAFRRLNEARSQILRELRNNFPSPLGTHEEDVHAENENLARLLLASGFYPDVAIGEGKRNQLRLQRILSASTVPGSVNYLLGTGVIEAALRSRGLRRDPHGVIHRRTGDTNNPRYFIYEELLDLGQKLVSKTTAVDPLVFILFARTLRFKYYRPSGGPKSGAESMRTHLVIDGWIAFRAESGSDLHLLTELRVHWNEFIQFVIYKQLRGESFDGNELQALSLFRETILALANECNVSREQQEEMLIECDRHGRPLDQPETIADEGDNHESNSTWPQSQCSPSSHMTSSSPARLLATVLEGAHDAEASDEANSHKHHPIRLVRDI